MATKRKNLKLEYTKQTKQNNKLNYSSLNKDISYKSINDYKINGDFRLNKTNIKNNSINEIKNKFYDIPINNNNIKNNFLYKSSKSSNSSNSFNSFNLNKKKIQFNNLSKKNNK